MQPDEIDSKIIDILRAGNATNSDVARALGVAEGTIRQRLKRLREAGIITVRGQINPDALVGQQLALVAIKVAESRLLDSKAAEIAKLTGVTSVMIVSGRFDILAEVLVDSNKGLVQFLTKVLSQVDGITGTETFVVLKSHGKWV